MRIAHAWAGEGEMLVRLVGTICAVLLISTAGKSLACSCEPPPPPHEALEQSVAVFSGTVTGVEDWDTANDGLFWRITLSVSETWAGPEGGEIDIVTASDGARCGYPFDVGGQYLVYAHGYRTEDERLPATGLCTRTRLLEEAEADLVDLRRATLVGDVLWGRLKAVVISLLR